MSESQGSKLLKLEEELSLNSNNVINKPNPANKVDFKTEIDVDEEIFKTDTENFKEITMWGKNFNDNKKEEKNVLNIQIEIVSESEIVLQESASKNQIYIKTEMPADFGGDVFELSKVQNIKVEETWETNLEASDIDPLKLDDNHADGADIKLEKGIKAEIEIVPVESIPESHSIMKTEISSDKDSETTKDETYIPKGKKSKKEKGRHICDICSNKTFHRGSSLKLHKMMHERTKTLSCDVCSKSFPRVFHLKRHKQIHTGEKPHVCDICSKAFLRESSLKQHKLIHTGVKTFNCDVCNKLFLTPGNLKLHKQIHSGERPHVCDVCNKSFLRASTLKDHKLIHTAGAAVKKFNCDTCSKSFRRSNTLKQHKLTHTNPTTVKVYFCDVCNESYLRLFHLKIHKRFHTGERPHVCDICSNAFLFSSQLNQHKMIHRTEKAFKYRCNSCNKAFSESHELNAHQLIHAEVKKDKPDSCKIKVEITTIT